MTPSGDEWFETEVTPDLIINVEGNFDTVLNLANRNSIGTVWNSWKLNGVELLLQQEEISNGFGILERTIQTTRSDLRRTGLRTDVVENIEEESQGTRVIARTTYTFCKTKNYKFCWTRVFTEYKTICVF